MVANRKLYMAVSPAFPLLRHIKRAARNHASHKCLILCWCNISSKMLLILPDLGTRPLLPVEIS